MSLLGSALLGRYEAGDSSQADCIIGHSFGTLTSAQSVNAALAKTALVAGYSADKPLLADYVFAEALPADSPKPQLVVLGPLSTVLGSGTGTWGTLLSAREYMKYHELTKPLLIAQAFHVGRVAMQATKLGMQPILPPNLPRRFEAESAQPWTRSRLFWMPRELGGASILKLTGKL